MVLIWNLCDIETNSGDESVSHLFHLSSCVNPQLVFVKNILVDNYPETYLSICGGMFEQSSYICSTLDWTSNNKGYPVIGMFYIHAIQIDWDDPASCITLQQCTYIRFCKTKHNTIKKWIHHPAWLLQQLNKAEREQIRIEFIKAFVTPWWFIGECTILCSWIPCNIRSGKRTKQKKYQKTTNHRLPPMSPHIASQSRLTALQQQLSIHSLELMQGPDKHSPCHSYMRPSRWPIYTTGSTLREKISFVVRRWVRESNIPGMFSDGTN